MLMRVIYGPMVADLLPGKLPEKNMVHSFLKKSAQGITRDSRGYGR
jgi:hypothetical protein